MSAPQSTLVPASKAPKRKRKGDESKTKRKQAKCPLPATTASEAVVPPSSEAEETEQAMSPCTPPPSEAEEAEQVISQCTPPPSTTAIAKVSHSVGGADEIEEITTSPPENYNVRVMGPNGCVECFRTPPGITLQGLQHHCTMLFRWQGAMHVNGVAMVKSHRLSEYRAQMGSQPSLDFH